MANVEELVERGKEALKEGNRLVARGYWRRASRLAPDRLDVWLDLCQVTELPQDRLRCLERVVELDPANADARAELKELREELVPVVESSGVEASETSQSVISASVAKSPTMSAPVQTDMRPDVTDEMRRQWDEAIKAGKPLVCIDHPHRETNLRCNRCSAPICAECAVRTPVGFRCRECIKAQQAGFFTAHWYDYLVAAAVSLFLSVPAAFIAGLAGWWFALIISPFAGGLLGGIVHRAVGRRRGRWIWLAVGVCVVLGALLVLAFRPRAFISLAIYAATATGAAIGILRLGRTR